jgi:uncharacterized protein YbjT (DUF2867 family)
VAGASGLVGREILRGLLTDNDYAAVHSLGRRPLDLQHAKLQSHTVDFAALGPVPAVDEVFVALGTTIKVAGSQEAFRAVDFDAVVAVARAARAAGATRLGVVSAMGASTKSALFYNRVKGEMEEALSRMGYSTLVIARPSFLAGDRAALNQPIRGGEGLALSLSRSLRWLIPANYRSVAAHSVADALRQGVKAAKPGKQVLLSGVLQQGAHANG